MSGTKLTIGASQDILLTKQDRFYTIRETDWNRLKRLITTCKIGIEWWSIFASVLFGIAGSAALSAITLLNDKTSSVKLVMWIISVAALLMGIICVIAASGNRKERSHKIDERQKTLQEIEALLPRE